MGVSGVVMRGMMLAQTTGAGGSAATAPAGGPPGIHALFWWLPTNGWELGVAAAAIMVVILVVGLILARIFHALLDKYQLMRPVRWGMVALAIYVGLLLAAQHEQVKEIHDVITPVLDKVLAAVLTVVAIRVLDRLLVIPVLTRGGRVTLSRFIHQIVIAVLCLFVLSGYVHWAFGVDISSLLAGSAVISIVLGLALQETLGNFFSGMVLQASAPFAPGEWVQLADGTGGMVEGRVVEMTWRAVTLLTAENNHVLVPNSIVSRSRIVNYHTPTPATSFSIAIGLGHSLPPAEARRVLVEAAAETPGVLADPAPSVALSAYTQVAVNYTLGFWIDAPHQHGAVEQAVRVNVWYRLQRAGIPVPHDPRAVDVPDEAARARALAARRAALGGSPLFAALSPALQEKLAAETPDFELAPGQIIYRQDEPGDSLFLVLSGTLHATFRAGEGREVDIGDTTVGGVFGELSAMTGHPRVATVRAKTDVRVMEITRQHLQDLFAADPALMKHMSEVVAASQARREAAFRKLGAEHPVSGQDAQAHGLLDRMKRLFKMTLLL